MNQIRDEGIKNPEKYSDISLSKDYAESAIAFILNIIDKNLDTFTYKFPALASVSNVYAPIDNTDWTSIFWTGMLSLAYEIS